MYARSGRDRLASTLSSKLRPRLRPRRRGHEARQPRKRKPRDPPQHERMQTVPWRRRKKLLETRSLFRKATNVQHNDLNMESLCENNF